MNSVDTNILVRYYTADDPVQSPLAARLIEQRAPIFVPKSVVLELVWVLESRYGIKRQRLLEVLRHLAALETAQIEDASCVETAIHDYGQGLEFEDALHLASSQSCERFYTFDRKSLARRAKRLGLKPDCEIPA